MVHHTPTSVVTIDRYIIEQERLYPEATGELSGILYDIALAAKMIARVATTEGASKPSPVTAPKRPTRGSRPPRRYEPRPPPYVRARGVREG